MKKGNPSVDERRVLADWKGFVDWLVSVVPREYQAACRAAVNELPQRDRRAAKRVALELLPPDTCLAVRSLIEKPGPMDHLVE